MEKIKKAGILAGGVIGGLIGGTLSVAGKMSKVKLLDELGTAIVDSTLLTGRIAGDIASGAVDVVQGSIKKEKPTINRGVADLKSGGTQVFKNWKENFFLIADESGEILEGVKERNPHKVLSGTKTLGKVAAISFITVGAVKVEKDEPAVKAKKKPAQTAKPEADQE